VTLLVKVTTTSYGGSDYEEYDRAVLHHLENLIATVSKELDEEFQDEEERKSAEMALKVAAKLLQAHLKIRTRYGHLPTN
jgi:nitrogenase molybdenum-iron protein alpha/beta subunit